jgi:DHA1 family bicyclomycin/chloramphenicol resistance-like MFS transporter
MNPSLVLAILILTTSVAMMSIDLYAPSLPHLPGYFGTTPEYVKLTMSLNSVAYALGTLVHGPLSERFGRRPVLLWGMAGFMLFSLCCAVSQTIGQLLAARILQGFSAAVEGVVVLAIIRDVFAEREQVRALAMYGVATALTPVIAPIIGGYVYVYFGWRMNFYGLTGAAFIAGILIWIYLQESGRKDFDALRPREIIRDYLGLLRDRNYLCYVLIGGATVGFFFAFITAGPFIFIQGHGLPTEYFGYFQGMLVIAYSVGSMLAGRLAARHSGDRIMLVGVGAVLLGSTLLLIVIYGGFETPFTLIATLCLIAFGDGPVFATTPSLAMASTESRTGPAAAMFLAIEVGIGALAALAVSVFHDGTSRPFAVTTILLCALIVGALLLRKNRGQTPIFGPESVTTRKSGSVPDFPD